MTNEFLGAYGIRGLSRIYREHPYELNIDGATPIVGYQPAKLDSGLFGGNSNWPGPLWFPVNCFIIDAKSFERTRILYGRIFEDNPLT